MKRSSKKLSSSGNSVHVRTRLKQIKLAWARERPLLAETPPQQANGFTVVARMGAKDSPEKARNQTTKARAPDLDASN